MRKYFAEEEAIFWHKLQTAKKFNKNNKEVLKAIEKKENMLYARVGIYR